MNAYRLDRYVKVLFILILYFIGLNLAEDYGISWDDNARRVGSKSHAKEVGELLGIKHPSFKNIPKVKDSIHAWSGPYGMIFEFPALLLEEMVGSENTREIFLYKHKLIFTFHFLGIIAFFSLAKEIFFTRNKAIFSTLIYSLHPRIFAHSFFNPKDIIFLSLLTVSLYAIVKLYKTKKNKWLIVSSIIMGLAMSCRIVGLYMPFLVIIFYLIDTFMNSRTLEINYITKSISVCICIIFVSFLSLYIATPYYWFNPISHFIETFQMAKQFPFMGNNFIFGNYIPAINTPWYYLPVWIFITTPITYLIFFSIGLILLICKIPIQIKQNFIFIFCLSALLIPYLSFLVLHSTVYDGWRHFYFLYLFISIITSYGFFYFYSYIICKLIKKNTLYIKIGFVLIIFILPLKTIYSIHPHQQTYFNLFGGEDPMSLYEGDYWGTSYRQGLEYIVDNDRRDSIYIKIGNAPGSLNRHILKKKERKRLIFKNMVNDKDYFIPDYYITNFRDKIDEYKLAKNNIPPFDNEVYSIDIHGMKILGVYKYK